MILAVLAVSLAMGTSPGIGEQSSLTVFALQSEKIPANASQTESPSAAPAQTSEPAKSVPSNPKHKKRTHKKPHASQQKVIVKNGSTADPTIQFSTAGSQAQAAHQRQDTDGLLASANSNLQKLSGHPLTPSQDDSKTQINGYITQAKAAEASGDLQSAYNLALKANLLSKELAGK